MFRASTILKNAREDKGLSYLEVSKKLKIPQKYLESIESESQSTFPSEPYCSLIIKDYANFLGLSGDDILSLFRRDFAQKIKPNNIAKLNPSLTPQIVFKFFVVISILFFLFYIVFEYLKFNRPPFLQVNWPEISTISNHQSIDVSGSTDPEATVRVNNDLIIVDQNGSFKKSVSLLPESTKIIIESRSHSGKTTVLEKTYHAK